MRNISYGDELYLLTLVLRELEQSALLELESTRFLDRLQANIAFLDEALAEYQAALCAKTSIPGKLEFLRRLCRLETGFCVFLAGLAQATTAIGKAFSPLREAILAMERRHSDLVATGRRVLAEAGEKQNSEVNGISDEEFRILLSPDEPGEAGEAGSERGA